MPGQGIIPVSGVRGTHWPWMLPEGTPGTPVRDRKRDRRQGFLASLLARLWPPAGSHHAVPGTPAEDPPPPPAPSWDGSCSPGAVTLTDFQAVRVPQYAPQQRGGRHRA